MFQKYNGLNYLYKKMFKGNIKLMYIFIWLMGIAWVDLFLTLKLGVTSLSSDLYFNIILFNKTIQESMLLYIGRATRMQHLGIFCQSASDWIHYLYTLYYPVYRRQLSLQFRFCSARHEQSTSSSTRTNVRGCFPWN